MYDFDKTLTPKDMQEFTFIPQTNMTPEDFWRKSNDLKASEKMDGILSYMYTMISEARYKNINITSEALNRMGENLEYYPGVSDFFDRINRYAEGLGIELEHYIISSGLREIIDGSVIRKNFKEVFACEFYYDPQGSPVWPKNVINYTTKTQFIFRINKGVLDISDDNSLNRHTHQDERRIPFRNMVYIGDGLTDVPCMKLVKVRGGYSIAVYTDKKQVLNLICEDRVNYIAKADYSENSELDSRIKDILVTIALNDKLKRESREQLVECQNELSSNT
jgi:2-hydroxy-3-keto-5-methylthiopentenyl-1-phosphate phosphatase